MCSKYKNIMKILYILFFVNTWSAFGEEIWSGACENNFPPYNYIKDGKMIGMDTEIVELVMNKIGVKYTVKSYPWQSVLNYLEDEEVDFIWQIVETPERKNKFYLIGPIREGIMVFLVRNDSPIKGWRHLKDFKGKKVGVVKGFRYTRNFDQNTGFEKVEYTNNEKLVLSLIDRDIDIIIGDLATLTYQVKILNSYNIVRFLPNSIKRVPRYVAFSKKNKDKSIIFQQGLISVKRTQEYNDIIDKYTKLKIK